MGGENRLLGALQVSWALSQRGANPDRRQGADDGNADSVPALRQQGYGNGNINRGA